MQNGRLYKQEAGQWSYSSKECTVSGKATFPWGKAGVYQAGYLMSADRVILDWLIKGWIPGRTWNYDR